MKFITKQQEKTIKFMKYIYKTAKYCYTFRKISVLEF